MAWSNTDTAEINAKLTLLEEYEKSCEEQLDKIRDTVRALQNINMTDPKDVDDTDLDDTRRINLKTSLMSKADTILASS